MSTTIHPRNSHRVEWRTVMLIAATTLFWAGTVYLIGRHGWWPLVALAVLCVTLHSSCQHEALHGHPTRNRLVNEALVFITPGVFFPYRRFKATHLQHHHDEWLTDPYEDPETNFMTPADWQRLNPLMRAILKFNNTLAGRLTIGPALGVTRFYIADAKAILAGDRRIAFAWLLHAVGLAITFAFVVGVAHIHPLFYVFAIAYPGYSLLTIRTFAEHRAEAHFKKRTCIIEDRGLFGFLFLNNNLHVVHHNHPTDPWYRMPELFRANREHYLTLNGGYHFPSYWALFRTYFVHQKAPVPHPLMDVGMPPRQTSQTR